MTQSFDIFLYFKSQLFMKECEKKNAELRYKYGFLKYGPYLWNFADM